MTNNDIIITTPLNSEKIQEQLDALQADVDLLYDIIEVVSLADDLVEILDGNKCSELPVEIIECVSKYKKLRSNIFEDEEDDDQLPLF